MNDATHPRPARLTSAGAILRRELAARGWTQRDLAEVIGRPAQAISEIVQGSKRITAETALELAEARRAEEVGRESPGLVEPAQLLLGRERGIGVRSPCKTIHMIILSRIFETEMASERVTITLPAALVDGIDRCERNRSRFIAEAVAHELARRRRQGLLRSIANPHPEAVEVAEAGLAEWGAALPSGDDGLVDASSGRPVRWIEGKGWTKGPA